MSEPAPIYKNGDKNNDGRPATQEAMATRYYGVPPAVAGEEAWANACWLDATAEALKQLAERGAFAPGDALRVERIDLSEDLAIGWVAVTARVTVEPSAARPAPVEPPPACWCYTCRALAEMWDNPLDAEYDRL